MSSDFSCTVAVLVIALYPFWRFLAAQQLASSAFLCHNLVCLAVRIKPQCSRFAASVFCSRLASLFGPAALKQLRFMLPACTGFFCRFNHRIYLTLKETVCVPFILWQTYCQSSRFSATVLSAQQKICRQMYWETPMEMLAFCCKSKLGLKLQTGALQRTCVCGLLCPVMIPTQVSLPCKPQPICV